MQANTGEAPARAFPVKFTKYLRAHVLKNICERLLLPITYSSKFLKDFILFLPNVLYLQGRRVEAKSHHDSQMANQQTWLIVCNFVQIILLFNVICKCNTWLVNVFVYVFFFLKLMLLKYLKRTNVQKLFNKNQVLMCSDLHKKYRRYRLDPHLCFKVYKKPSTSALAPLKLFGNFLNYYMPLEIKKRLQHVCFLEHFAKYLVSEHLTEQLVPGYRCWF